MLWDFIRIGIDSVDPLIILSARHKIMQQPINIFSIPDQLYKSENDSISITGKYYVFNDICDEQGKNCGSPMLIDFIFGEVTI